MIVTHVKCNDCGCTSAPVSGAVKVHALRARLKKNGWQVGLQGGKDRCKYCVRVLKLEKEDRHG